MGDFWMFMYYRQGDTDIEHLKGAVKFRIHVIKRADEAVEMPNVHLQGFGGGETVWFLCDAAEEIEKSDGSLLSLHDFKHLHDKQLASAMRSSIAPVIQLEKDIRVRKAYPDSK